MQVDPLLELMTGRETLWLFARLKRIRPSEAATLVCRLLEQVGLSPHADKPCGTYSGGNKRKLSLAIALVGSPAVVFLDEPSSGMDPLARRHMWDVLTEERTRRSIVLTSHSMEECEALCTRIGIMSSGRLRCVGGQQHLKNKFGDEFTLEVRLAAKGDGGHEPSAAAPSLHARTEAAVQALFPGATLADYHGATLKFRIPSTVATLPDVFEAMEANKAALHIQDYACSQPRLEDIFLGVVAQDQEQQEAQATAAKGQ